MIENYKGWNITLTWDDKHSTLRDNYIKTTYNQKEKWRGENLTGKKIYGASLKEIRHIIDYPLLYRKLFNVKN